MSADLKSHQIRSIRINSAGPIAGSRVHLRNLRQKQKSGIPWSVDLPV